MLKPLIFLVFTAALSGFSNSQSVSSSKIYNFESSDGTARIFYTDLTQAAVFQRFDASKYPISKDLGIGMLTSLPLNCSCPDLRPIHSIIDSNGILKFEFITDGNYQEDLGLSGYLAPFPGYCNSDSIELIEFYSPVLDEYRYDTFNNIWNYYSDFTYFFRPVRVMGYAYYSTPSVWMSGTPPYIVSGASSPVYKALSVRFEVVKSLTRNSQKIYVTNTTLINQLTSDGWVLMNGESYGPLSLQNDITTIQQKCGPVQKCVDTFNATSGLYIPKNSVTQNLNGLEIMGECGYFLSDQAKNQCFSQAVPFYSYSPSYNPEQVLYVSYNDNSENANAVGNVYPYLFTFLKL